MVQDQDYRNANVQEKISKTIAISGIPKTATMQQVGCVTYEFFLVTSPLFFDCFRWQFHVFSLPQTISFIDTGCIRGTGWSANARHENKRCCSRWDFAISNLLQHSQTLRFSLLKPCAHYGFLVTIYRTLDTLGFF